MVSAYKILCQVIDKVFYFLSNYMDILVKIIADMYK